MATRWRAEIIDGSEAGLEWEEREKRPEERWGWVVVVVVWWVVWGVEREEKRERFVVVVVCAGAGVECLKRGIVWGGAACVVW